jgi:hypothetical protein
MTAIKSPLFGQIQKKMEVFCSWPPEDSLGLQMPPFTLLYTDAYEARELQTRMDIFCVLYFCFRLFFCR